MLTAVLPSIYPLISDRAGEVYIARSALSSVCVCVCVCVCLCNMYKYSVFFSFFFTGRRFNHSFLQVLLFITPSYYFGEVMCSTWVGVQKFSRIRVFSASHDEKIKSICSKNIFLLFYSGLFSRFSVFEQLLKCFKCFCSVKIMFLKFCRYGSRNNKYY